MDELKQIIKMLENQDKKISNIEKILEESLGNKTKTKTETQQKRDGDTNEYTGLAGAIFDLTKTSFFNTPKELKEIREQLEANAVFYPRTNYPDALLRLVKHKKLRRLKVDKKWKYVKNE